MTNNCVAQACSWQFIGSELAGSCNAFRRGLVSLETPHMRRCTIPAVLITLILFACQKKGGPRLQGVYTEHSPVAGRSQLIFMADDKVIRREPGSTFIDTFHFRLDNAKIVLTPAWTNQYLPVEFNFEIIDNSSFKIESLYPSIGLQSGRHMVFKK